MGINQVPGIDTVPGVVGQSGKYLTTDGKDVSWGAVASLSNAVGKITANSIGGVTYTYTNTFNPGSYLVTQNQTARVTFGSNTITTSAAQNAVIATTASSISIDTTAIAQWSSTAATGLVSASYIEFVSGVGYVAAGTSALYSSTDGITWTSRPHPASGLGTVFLASNPTPSQKFLMGGIGGWLASSTDGITWTTRNGLSGGNNIVSGCRAGNSQAYAIHLSSPAGGLRLSTDGVTWVTRNSGLTNAGQVITWGNNYYVGVDSSTSVRSSTDGVTWVARTHPVQGSSYILNFAADVFIIFYLVSGGNNTPFLAVSTDRITWVTRSPNTPLNGGGSWIKGDTASPTFKYMVSAGSTVVSSTDAITWVSRNSGQPNSVVWASNVWVGITSETTLRSPNTVGYVLSDYYINLIGPTAATTIA